MDYKKTYYQLHTNFHESDSEKKAKAINLLIDRIKDYKLDSIIDIACGSGQVLLNILEHKKFGKAVGVDISKDAIEKAIKNDSQNKVSWVLNDFGSVKNEVFSLVLLIDIIEHIPDDKSFLNDLKKIGKLFIIKVPIEKNVLNDLIKYLSLGRIDLCKTNKEKYGHIHYYTRKSFLNTLEKANFELLDTEYMSLPKRSKFGWELLRLILYPLWFISRIFYLKLNGGFIVVLVKSR